jgi:RNA-directed DNA polymerase
MCRSRAEAERALAALRAILSELGLTLKDAKTRIVELREGGEGLEFLGFDHRWVRGNTPASGHLCCLARWPSRQAMQHARDRIREVTDRRRLLPPVEDVVQDVNRFLRGWAGYFRYGNSADAFDKITLHALVGLAGVLAKRHKRKQPVRLLDGHPPGSRPARTDQPRRSHRRAPAIPAVATGSRMPTVKNVGEPSAGEPRARIEAAAGGNQANRASTAAQPRRLSPTLLDR